MSIAFAADDYGRLVAEISLGAEQATVTASDLAQAAHDLAAALEDALRDGAGECYWREGGGEYRWMFRTAAAGATLRVAVLWSNGTLTGWEHVLWAEAPAVSFAVELRTAIAALPAPAV